MMRTKSFFLQLLCVLSALPALTQESFSLFGETTEHVRLSIEFDQDRYDPGAEVTGRVVAAIDEGWHINSITPNEEYLIPTSLSIESPSLTEVSWRFPDHIERTFGFAGDVPLAVYEGEIEIPFQGRRTDDADERLIVELYYQACDDAVCLPPTTASLTGTLGVSVVNEEGRAPSGERGREVVEGLAGGDPGGEFTPLSEAPAEYEGNIFSSEVGEVFEGRGLLLSLVVVFVLGLALNLTPCVYPLIPITVGFFSSQKRDRKGTILLSVMYVIGIAITYSALGVVSALSGALFGAWLQSTAVLVFFALLMLVLASSMFGLWDMTVPQFITARAGGKAGYAGALGMGLLAGVVAAPCVGPFVASLLAFVARQGDPVLGFILFFVLALGLGVPYLILGFSTSSVNALPRSGSWLVITKKALGFVLIGMAFYFLRPVLGDVFYKSGIALTALVGGIWLLARSAESRQEKMVGAALGVLILAAGAFLAWPSMHDTEIVWQPYDPALVASAADQGRPVMIDFYADWCIPCKELDARTFVDPDVVEESEKFVRLKADLTNGNDPASEELIEQYEILGVPTIVFIGPGGQEVEAARLIGFEKPDRFLQRMQRVD